MSFIKKITPGPKRQTYKNLAGPFIGPVRNSPPEPSTGAKNGYTLAELLVVIILISLIASITLPRVISVDEREGLRTACRRLAGLAVECFSDALTKTQARFLCVDLDLKRMWISSVRPGTEGEAGRESEYIKIPASVTIVDAEHPALGLIDEGRVGFGYWAQGGSEPGTVHFQSEDGEEMTVFLRPYMGRTEIKEGYLREEIN
jgi:prepilin-type N-terminal cleavage/methylation domain-containing protein